MDVHWNCELLAIFVHREGSWAIFLYANSFCLTMLAYLPYPTFIFWLIIVIPMIWPFWENSSARSNVCWLGASIHHNPPGNLGNYSLSHKALHPDIMIYLGFSDEMWSQNGVWRWQTTLKGLMIFLRIFLSGKSTGKPSLLVELWFPEFSRSTQWTPGPAAQAMGFRWG